MVLGTSDAGLLTELAARPSLQVQALVEKEDTVASLRETIRSTGKYGQISVNAFNGSELPYVDNLVNLVGCDESTTVPRDEIMRVIAPRSALFVKNADGHERIEKPVSRGMDEWNQFLHNAAPVRS